MRKTVFFITAAVVVISSYSCKTIYQPQAVKYTDYKIRKLDKDTNNLTVMLKPYEDSVGHTMNDIIAVAGMNLEKRSPEGTLGNVLADAMRIMAARKFNVTVDAAFVNSGGIRLPSIPAGNITRGRIYEIAPFDNLIVLLQIKGDELQKFLDLMASKDGWPCSGIRYEIRNGKAINASFLEKKLDANTVYTIAIVDYIANGGDNCDMLKNIPQQNKGYLFRDAIIEYFSQQSKEGKKIISEIEKRVSHAE